MSFNISWDAPNKTCGDMHYEVSTSQPPIEAVNTTDNAVVNTTDSFLNVTGLNNSLPNVTITVTVIFNRTGRGEDEMFLAELPGPLGKCCCTYIQK